jgi:hypothetical protein
MFVRIFPDITWRAKGQIAFPNRGLRGDAAQVHVYEWSIAYGSPPLSTQSLGLSLLRADQEEKLKISQRNSP